MWRCATSRTGGTIYTHTTASVRVDWRSPATGACWSPPSAAWRAAVSGWDARSGALRFRAATFRQAAGLRDLARGPDAGGRHRRRAGPVVDARTGRALAADEGPPGGDLAARVLARRAAARRVLGRHVVTSGTSARASASAAVPTVPGWIPGMPSSPTAGCCCSSRTLIVEWPTDTTDPAALRLPDRRPRPHAGGVAATPPEPAVPSRLSELAAAAFGQSEPAVAHSRHASLLRHLSGDCAPVVEPRYFRWASNLPFWPTTGSAFENDFENGHGG